MNLQMLKTELYKLFSRRIVWVAAVGFLLFFTLIYSQFYNNSSLIYDFEPVREEMTELIANENLGYYGATPEEIEPYVPKEVFEYIDSVRENHITQIVPLYYNHIYAFVNEYYERVYNREIFIEEVREAASSGENKTLRRAYQRLSAEYENSAVVLEPRTDNGLNGIVNINVSVVPGGLMMIVIIVGLSGVFSDEHTSSTESALLTSKNGRTGVYLAKLNAAGIYVFVIVAIMEAFYLGVGAVCYHVDNLNISAASTYGMALTLYEGKVWQLLIRQVLGALLSAVTVGSIAVFISSISKSSLIPFFGAGIYYGAMTLWGKIFGTSAVLTTPMSLPWVLSPDTLRAQTKLLYSGHYTDIFGVLVPSMALNVVFNIALSAVCLVLAYRSYIKKQVKG